MSQTEVLNLKTNDLILEAKLALLQIQPQKIEIPTNTIPLEISNITETEIPTKQFYKLFQKLLFKNGFP